jgi:type II secretory pathway component PulF
MSSVELPWITRMLIYAGAMLPPMVATVGVLILAMLIAWPMLRRTSHGRTLADWLILHVPLFGPPLRWNLAARWCDAVRIGAEAGVDLPNAIELADDVVASPAMSDDGAGFVTALREGQRLATHVHHPRMIPATVPAAIDLAARKSDLPNVLFTLAELYQRQAEIRLAVIPTVLTPLLMFIIAVVIGAVIIGLMLPLLRLFTFLGAGGSL